MTIKDACNSFLRDGNASNLSESSQNEYQALFSQMQAFAKSEGLAKITDMDNPRIRAWRQTWDVKPGTHETRLNLLSAFFRFCQASRWIKESPIANLKPTRSTASPSSPLSRREMRRLIRHAEGSLQEWALLLLMRYSGLTIQDAVALSRDAITGTVLVLRRAKTRELVVVELPRVVLDALKSIAEPGSEYYFRNGNSKPVTAAKVWRDRLQRLALRAGVEGFRPHRLRNTFAVELLLQGVAVEDVSVLLGHGSTSITERYYAPWCRTRREGLVRIVREANSKDPILTSLVRPVARPME